MRTISSVVSSSLLLSSLLWSLWGCLPRPGAEQGSAGSDLASLSVGRIKPELLQHDTQMVRVKNGAEEKMFSDSESMATAKYKAGESVTISLQLMSSGKIVAQTSKTDSRCNPVTATLVGGANKIKVPVCLYNPDGGVLSGPPIVTDPNLSSDLEIDPCLVDKENCGPDGTRPNSTGTPNPPGGAITGNFPGKCNKEGALFKTANGGCQFQENGTVFSKLSNFNGEYKKLMRQEAVGYCSNLTEGGFSDWELASMAQLTPLTGRSQNDYLAGAYSGLTVWTADIAANPTEPNARVVARFSSDKVARDNYSFQYDQKSSFAVFCVRR